MEFLKKGKGDEDAIDALKDVPGQQQQLSVVAEGGLYALGKVGVAAVCGHTNTELGRGRIQHRCDSSPTHLPGTDVDETELSGKGLRRAVGGVRESITS